MTTPTAGQTVTASQPGCPEFTGRVIGAADLPGFLRVEWSGHNGRTMVATVHAARCEVV